jgi:hypothetical protein
LVWACQNQTFHSKVNGGDRRIDRHLVDPRVPVGMGDRQAFVAGKQVRPGRENGGEVLKDCPGMFVDF